MATKKPWYDRYVSDSIFAHILLCSIGLLLSVSGSFVLLYLVDRFSNG